jgi:glycosyltransferase involved in cell wall biosynthesis
MKVSVVVSCYNYGGFLAGAVDSALRQTHADLEVIIVDDGSTDDTPAVAAKLAAADPRVIYLRQENLGQAAAKNSGIARATGAFVAFLDADDRWRPEKLERQLPLFNDPRVGVVYSRMRPIAEDGSSIDDRDTAAARQPKRGAVCEALFIDNFIPFSSSVVRKAVFDRVGVMDTSLPMGIDWDLWLRASLHFHFDFVDDELLEYRVGHAGQMSLRLEERHRWADQIMENFAARNPGAVTAPTMRRARRNTLNNRGLFYRASDLRRSTALYLRSVATSPIQWYAYRGLMANLFHRLVRGFRGAL